MTGLPEEVQKLVSIFLPSSAAARQRMIDRAGRFVHYTTAENAMKIIQSRQLWLRDTRCMNDYSEVYLGYTRLREHFGTPKKDPLIAALEDCAPRAAQEAISRFDGWWPQIPQSTFIGCFSEHDASEDTHGRLSMWRSYGRTGPGVALVFRLPLGETVEGLEAIFFNPVLYHDADRFGEEMAQIERNVRASASFLRGLPRDTVVNSIYLMLLLAAVSSKHPGFHEEREWRVVHAPLQFPSKTLLRSTESIAGIPQTVHKIPLGGEPGAGIPRIALPQILDRVIIGPSAFPGPIATALIGALAEAGVPEPGQKVFVSDIPLRT